MLVWDFCSYVGLPYLCWSVLIFCPSLLLLLTFLCWFLDCILTINIYMLDVVNLGYWSYTGFYYLFYFIIIVTLCAMGRRNCVKITKSVRRQHKYRIILNTCCVFISSDYQSMINPTYSIFLPDCYTSLHTFVFRYLYDDRCPILLSSLIVTILQHNFPLSLVLQFVKCLPPPSPLHIFHYCASLHCRNSSSRCCSNYISGISPEPPGAVIVRKD